MTKDLNTIINNLQSQGKTNFVVNATNLLDITKIFSVLVI